MRFVSLADHPEYTPILLQNMENNSDWHEILPWLEEMTQKRGKEKLPIITIAFDGDDMIGFFVLSEKELLKDTLPYTPWLGILMVFDRFRGHSFSPIMIEEACKQASSAGYDTLYLATEHIHYYERFGFEEIGLANYQWGAPTKIYRRNLNRSYTFSKAISSDIHTVFHLIKARVQWMDQVGIHQWNETNYLEAYPLSYYEEQQRSGSLYVLKDGSILKGAVVLLEEDDRWLDRTDHAAFYIHNLVTDPAVSGAGNTILQEIEKLAVSNGKTYLRLDCAIDNAFLNHYYEEHGYKLAGQCSEGLYIGNRREKQLNGELCKAP